MVAVDQLNAHTPAALYKVFPPAEAKRILDRPKFHFTPKHGNWLNMAEIEFSLLSHQCLSGYIADQVTLEREVLAWETERNSNKATVEWRFTTDDARIKLKKLYPVVYLNENTRDPLPIKA